MGMIEVKKRLIQSHQESLKVLQDNECPDSTLYLVETEIKRLKSELEQLERKTK